MHEEAAQAEAEPQPHPGTQTQGMFPDPTIRWEAHRFDDGRPRALDETASRTLFGDYRQGACPTDSVLANSLDRIRISRYPNRVVSAKESSCYFPSSDSVLPRISEREQHGPDDDQRDPKFERAKRKREGGEPDEEHTDVRQPLPSAQVKDLVEDLPAVPDHQRDEDEKGDGGDQELEGELGVVIVEGEEQPDLVPDEAGADPEHDGVDPGELLVVIHNAQPAGHAHHREPVPAAMEVDSLGDDLEAGEREVQEPGPEQGPQDGDRREVRQSVLESASLRQR